MTNKTLQLSDVRAANNVPDTTQQDNRGNSEEVVIVQSKIDTLNATMRTTIEHIQSHLDSELPVKDTIISLSPPNYTEEIQSYNLYLSYLESLKPALDSINNIKETISILESRNENLISKIEGAKREKYLLDSGIVLTDKKLKPLQHALNKKIQEHLNYLEKTNKYKYSVKKVELEINNGYLENIEVIGTATVFNFKDILQYDSTRKIPEFQLKFISDFPIGISSKKDIERIGNYRLYSRFNKGMHYEMKLGNLISIINEKLAEDRKDYSPKDGDHTFILPEDNNATFKKADTREILQMKVFTDFVGLNAENPNGLIQLEIDKEIPLYTKRIQRPFVWIPFRWVVMNQANVGVLNFFKPQFIYSKIENNNKYLQVRSFTTGTGEDAVSNYGVSTLQLKQYEIFSVGADLNVALYDIPGGKSTFLLNTGFRFGRTDLASNEEEPEVNDFPRGFTNTMQPSLEGLWRINGDERFGIEFSYKINWLLSDELFFTQKANTQNFTDFTSFNNSEENNTLQSFTLLAYLNIQKENPGRLFFRYRYNSEFSNFKNNYAQLQLGYTTYLTRANK